MQKAEMVDLENVLKLFKDVIHTMQLNGIVQWNEDYPNREILQQDIANGEMFVLKDQDQIIGCVTLNKEEISAYENVNWSSSEPALIIHRVAIANGYQGRGLVKQLLDFSEKYALESGIHMIKTDTSVSNNQMMSVYIKYGYQVVGQIFSRGRTVPLNCYEKKI